MRETPRLQKPSDLDSHKSNFFDEQLEFLAGNIEYCPGTDSRTKQSPAGKSQFQSVTVVCQRVVPKLEPLFVPNTTPQLKPTPNPLNPLMQDGIKNKEIGYLDEVLSVKEGVMFTIDPAGGKGTGRLVTKDGNMTDLINIECFDVIHLTPDRFAAIDFTSKRLLIIQTKPEVEKIRSSVHFVKCSKLYITGRPAVQNSMVQMSTGEIIFIGYKAGNEWQWDFNLAQPILFNTTDFSEKYAFITGSGNETECLATNPTKTHLYIASKGGIVSSARVTGTTGYILFQVCLSRKPEVRSQGQLDKLQLVPLDSGSLYTLINMKVSTDYVIVLYQTDKLSEGWLMFMQPVTLTPITSKKISALNQSSNMKILHGSYRYKKASFVCIFGRQDMQLYMLLPPEDGYISSAIQSHSSRDSALVNSVHYHNELNLIIFIGMGKKKTDTPDSDRYPNLKCMQLVF